MAYKKLADAMSGKPPPPKPAPATKVTTGPVVKPADPKSSVSTRDAYARAMNSGNREEAARLYKQMKDEEAAANVASKIGKR